MSRGSECEERFGAVLLFASVISSESGIMSVAELLNTDFLRSDVFVDGECVYIII